MSAPQSPGDFLNRTAVDPEGNKIGSVGQVYLDDRSGEANWISVNTGLFGMKEHFAPVFGSTVRGEDELVLPFNKDVVKNSPDIDDPNHLSVAEQEHLHRYYQQYMGGDAAGGPDVSSSVDDSGADRKSVSDSGLRTEGHDTSGPTTDEAMPRSEEHEVVLHAERPVVTTEAVAVERVRVGTETPSETESVSGSDGKEQIDLDDETAAGKKVPDVGPGYSSPRQS